MKVFKTFYEAQKAGCFKEIIQHPTKKNLLRLWNKNILTEIYRNIQTLAFQVLREFSFWASRNGTVQVFSLTPTRNMFAGKCVK